MRLMASPTIKVPGSYPFAIAIPTLSSPILLLCSWYSALCSQLPAPTFCLSLFFVAFASRLALCVTVASLRASVGCRRCVCVFVYVRVCMWQMANQLLCSPVWLSRHFAIYQHHLAAFCTRKLVYTVLLRVVLALPCCCVPQN